jgi:hypothetical protein
MKPVTLTNAVILPLILAALAAGLVYAVLAGKSLPFINTPRSAIIFLLVFGMALCALGGISQVGASGHWASPLAILGYVLGLCILAAAGAGLFGWQLPLVSSESQALLAMLVLMAGKLLVGFIGFFTKGL